MGKLNITMVPKTMLDLVWEKSIPHFELVVEKAPNEISLDTIYASISSGKTMYIAISEGDEIIAVNVLDIQVFDTGHKVLYIPITGGHRMSEWLDDFMALAHKIAASYECDELRGMSCRKGWLKALKTHNWYPLHEVIGCKVKQEQTT